MNQRNCVGFNQLDVSWVDLALFVEERQRHPWTFKNHTQLGVEAKA